MSEAMVDFLGDDEENLVLSQISEQDATGTFIRFIGRNNKAFKGGLGDVRLDNKNIKHYARGPRCIVDFYETYLKASGVFYRKPLISDVQDKHRYGKSALGVNKLNGLMREMCEKGGAWLATLPTTRGKRTALYQAGIGEQHIMERTGHRSTKGVRTYKTANSNIQKRVSDVLNPPVRS